MKPSENPRRDRVRSVYQCEALHGSYTRCTLADDHAGPHKNDSYTWTDQPKFADGIFPSAEQKAKFQEAISGGTSKVLEFKVSKKG